jgi:hypothetical protein
MRYKILHRSRRTRWVGHVTHMGDIRNVYKIWLEYLKGNEHFEDIGIYGRIILGWILKERGWRGVD